MGVFEELQAKGTDDGTGTDDGWTDFKGERSTNDTHTSTTDAEAKVVPRGGVALIAEEMSGIAKPANLARQGARSERSHLNTHIMKMQNAARNVYSKRVAFW